MNVLVIETKEKKTLYLSKTVLFFTFWGEVFVLFLFLFFSFCFNTQSNQLQIYMNDKFVNASRKAMLFFSFCLIKLGHI